MYDLQRSESIHDQNSQNLAVSRMSGLVELILLRNIKTLPVPVNVYSHYYLSLQTKHKNSK